MHDAPPLLTTIAVGFTLALALGIAARWLKMSPIAGYLLAGIIISPHSPGFVGDSDQASQLAEIGVILLMFGVGLHFHLKDLLAVRAIAIPGALLQSVAATLVAMLIAHLTGWTWSAGLVLGIAVSVASTVVLLRVLMDNECLETSSGHVAVGWLIVEDLITVLVLVMLPALASHKEGGSGVLATIGLAVFKLAVFGGLVAFAGPRFVPWLLLRVARLRSRELFTLAVLVMSIAVAVAAYFAFGASLALGAFLAGMLVGQSNFSHQAGAEMLPLRDAFAVLFFLSVGMLFDFGVILHMPGLVFGVLLVVLVVKPLIAFAIVIFLRHSLRTALMAAAGLAQIGEFSFILAQLSKSLKLLPDESEAVLVAVAVVSICLNPYLFKTLLKLEPWIARRPKIGPWLTRRGEARGNALNASHASKDKTTGAQAIVVGYGPVGQTVTWLLREFDVEPMIVDLSVDTVAELHNQKRPVLFGDAARPDILRQAGILDARFLIITLPDADARMTIIAAARELNPQINILTRARFLSENPTLREAGVTNIRFDEVETAAGLAEVVLGSLKVDPKLIDQKILDIRREWHLITELRDESLDPESKV